MPDIQKLAHQYFDRAANNDPNKVACVFGDERTTYGELRNYANQLTRTLVEAGVKRGDRVCFCLHKSINSVKAILGILKADAVYVPLDAFSPAARLEKIIADAEPRAVICDAENRSLTRKVAGKIAVLDLDKDKRSIIGQSKENLAYKNTGSDVAYIFYTSGSTGDPKGVMITHNNLVYCAEWAVNEFGITSKDVLSSHPPFHFDLSTFDIYACFKAGATLAIVPEKLSVFPGALLDYIEKHEMTIWNSVPSLLSYLAKSGVLAKRRMPSVKKVFFNGEVFPPKYLSQWMKTYPKKEFVNMYGPTEATVQCSFYRIKRPPKDFTKPVPIGKACAGAEIFALTDAGKRAKPSEEGELYIAGRGVGGGYWRNPQKTSESFVQNPLRKSKDIVYKTGDLVRLRSDGNYEFLGRIDHQIKHMGYRIELGEIESALYALSGVKEAAVVAYTDQEPTEIAAFVALTASRTIGSVRSDLENIIPKYMVPHRIHTLPALPKTSTGKADRVALKNMYAPKT